MSYKFLPSFFTIAAFSAFFLPSLTANAFMSMPADSIGVERKGNKVLVLYKVEAGETLSSISRKYRTTVDAIKAENSLGDSGLKLGDVIRVPYSAKPSVAGRKVHTVEASQTLYAIARMYNVTSEDIKKWNNLASNEISLGQELIVSGDGQAASSSTQAITVTENTAANTKTPTVSTNAAGQKVHVVEASQGLFSIARMYNVAIEDLRKWNNLKADNLKVGQELILEAPANAPAPTETTVETVAQASTEQPANVAESNKPETKEDIFIEEPETAPVAAQTTNAKTETTRPEKGTPKKEEKPVENTSYTISNTSGYVKKVESGLAEVIAGNSSSDMFLALHRTAPVGTIMQIRNQMNDLSVFVKVIGKLPDTGANDKVVVKISQKAYERLAAVDKRFRVELSYMP
ncbi:LysM peptidoglycan-binding domain-containing protein [Rhodocytophaga aerolata]|uniref:LysM peptidoglycan-binding domain-containing protein n=1 Tax=Rhodocytophaga aerolata TaxID=455078 RepID=A0ABT8R9M4_9BACT|nr:LysM peptidoglycan-binding domain-containing protein [Rhodocytophaga aerolata]MDO1447913.1 LysM peptidoglycan-binding domain-containing protein [Rhodocytophaga aerolata]